MRLSLVAVLASCSGSGSGGPHMRLESMEVAIDPAATPWLLTGGLDHGEIALTFDDGPDPITTRRILATLANYEVRATFFQVGRNAESYPDVTREILEQGHSVGSHSYDHADLSALGIDDAIANVTRGHAAVIGAAPFFRFPFFRSSGALLGAIEDLGFSTFHANIVSEDHATFDHRELLAKSLAAVDAENRGIIIFHDIQPQTAEMLDDFLAGHVARDYRTVVFVKSARR